MHTMQMSLTNPLPQPPAAGGGLQRLTPLSREAVMSQLDRIAASDAPPLPSQGLGGMAGMLAMLGGLIVVGMALMWRAPDEPARGATAQAAPAAVQVVSPAQAAAVPAATTPSAAPAAVSSPAPAPLLAVAPVRPEPAVAAAPAPVAKDDALRKARAKQQQAAARRKAAAQLAQEQALAQEAQRLAVLSQSQRERAAQAAEDERRRLAAEQKRAAAVVVAMDTSRRSVADICAGSGFFAQHSCRARECSKAEHQGDMVCVRLRESEEAQRRASADR
jgi:hypothetical protein